MLGDALIHDARAGVWRQLRNPLQIVTTDRIDEVQPLLAAIERRVESEELWAAGFVSYEAAAAFDPALCTHSATNLPLLWFALYQKAPPVALAEVRPAAAYTLGDWQSTTSETAYGAAIARIKQHIARGETYQVNYTFRLRADFGGDPLALFLDLQAAQAGRYAAYIDGGRWAICSASPELFFTRDGEHIESRPMKGTAARGPSWEADQAQIKRLRQSEKQQAENVMIVDMVRNDLGRIAQIGSVHVPALFEVTRYPTVLQLTSTVTARSSADLAALFAALFPCASISGAPKVRTMQIIRDLEPTARGVYCGAVGFVAPGRQAQFNVAIRSVTVDRERGSAEYGTGSGVIWDSEAADEYRESVLKAAILTERRPAFDLLESLRYDPQVGFVLLERHLRRLAQSACYFGFDLDQEQVRAQLTAAVAGVDTLAKVRLTVSRSGAVGVTVAPLPPSAGSAVVAVATEPIDSSERFIYHKTTRRTLYQAARRAHPHCDDVLLVNEVGEVTESTIANVVFRKDGVWYTPPQRCGLLPGTLRGHLLAEGTIREAVLLRRELPQVEALALINSVRGWRDAVLQPPQRHGRD